MQIPHDPTKAIAAIFLLPQCDMGCGFCGSDLGFDKLRFGEALELFDALHAVGYRSLVLGGGEPALWRDGERGLGELAHEAKRRGFLVQVNTNAIRLPEPGPIDADGSGPGGYLAWEAIDRFIFPMEGATAATHDPLRIVLGSQADGHFELIERRVAECIAAGQELTFGTVLTGPNVASIEALVELIRGRHAAGLKIHAWHLYRFQPVGRGGLTAGAEMAIDAEQYAQACRIAKGSGLAFPVWKRDDMLRSSTVEFFWRERGELKIGSQVWGAATSG